MRILHTADLHLQKDDEKTLEGLAAVLKKANDEDVDLVTIGGDLFDTEEDAEVLRADLREMFTDLPFQVLAIPGNHDAEAFRENTDFGPDIDVLADDPLEKKEYDDLVVVGVPFKSGMSTDLYEELRYEGEKDSILLLHCTLQMGYNREEAGEEEDYFPVSKETLSELDYDYVLAGHIHSDTQQVPLEGGEFIYPGSPVSQSRTETGQRHVFIIDTEEKSASGLPLETFYYASEEWKLKPGKAEEFFDDLREWIEEKPDYCEELITVSGTMEIDEEEFSKRLRDIAGGAEVTNRTKNVEEVLEHPLYRRFRDKMGEDIDDKSEVNDIVIESMSELIADREISQ